MPGHVHFGNQGYSALKRILAERFKLLLSIEIFVVEFGKGAYGQSKGLVLGKMDLQAGELKIIADVYIVV